MRKIAFYFILFFTTFFEVQSQCKIESFTVDDTNTKGYFSKKPGFYHGTWNTLFIYVYKIGTDYFLKGSYSTSYSSEFQINKDNPIIYKFINEVDIILYPTNESQSYWTGGLPTYSWWNKSSETMYDIDSEQLNFLMNNIPEEVRYYYTSENNKSKHSDQYGNYTPIYYKVKAGHKRTIEAIKCILNL